MIIFDFTQTWSSFNDIEFFKFIGIEFQTLGKNYLENISRHLYLVFWVLTLLECSSFDQKYQRRSLEVVSLHICTWALLSYIAEYFQILVPLWTAFSCLVISDFLYVLYSHWPQEKFFSLRWTHLKRDSWIQQVFPLGAYSIFFLLQ